MIDATRRWLRRNRTTFALGAGVIGVGYMAGQYAISKIGEARERMISERVAKENLRRRFQQNQEDCSITVTELLPTITENVLAAQPSEQITQELQLKKAQRVGKSSGASDVALSEPSVSARSTVDDERGSLSSESYVHAHLAASSSSEVRDLGTDKTKAQLWHDLKISSLTRAFTLIYMISLLSLLTRVQLNLLGRRSYLASLIAQASTDARTHTIHLEDRADEGRQSNNDEDFELNRQYLTFSWWLLHKGWQEIMTRVQSAVIDVFGPVKPTADMRAEQFSSLVLELRKRVEGFDADDRANRSWLSVLLPPQGEEGSVLRDAGVSSSLNIAPTDSNDDSIASINPVTPTLRHLLDETADVLESPIFHSTLSLLLDTSYSRLVDDRVRIQAYKTSSIDEPQFARVHEVSDHAPPKPVKLASILAVITKEAHQIGSASPNEYVSAIDALEDLDAFSAVIYSSNFESDQERLRFLEDPLPQSVVLDDDGERSGQEAQPTLIDKAANLADTAWTSFESVWTKVTG